MSDDFLTSPGPSTNYYYFHQGNTTNMDLKHPSSETGLNEDNPKRIKIRGIHPYCIRKIPFKNCSQEPSFSATAANDATLHTDVLFNHMPILIMEKIFIRLPFRDLLRARLVCKSWKQVIDNSKFLMWKKAYHEVKAKRYSSTCWVNTWFYYDKQDALGVNCFDALIRFMAEFQRNPPFGLITFLKNMPGFDNAKILLLQKFQDSPLLRENLWCILTVIILLSTSVNDLYVTLQPLVTHYESESSVISEALFCIATSLLYFMKKSKMSREIHYRLHYVLYLLENKPFTYSVRWVRPKAKGVPELNFRKCPPEKLTYEQLEIVNHQLAPKQVIKICSAAGTGKTATLIQFAEKHPELRFLYLSTSIESYQDTKLKFPSNVDCQTPYLMAHKAIAKKYINKFSRDTFDIAPFLHYWSNFNNHQNSYAKSVALTIERFCQSADQNMTKSHTLLYGNELCHRVHLYNQPDASSFDRNELMSLIILNEAIEVWKKVVSPTNLNFKTWPDVYLKLYQLSHPQLSYKYNCIMVDQAEDHSPAALDIALSQNIPVFLVGDYNQQILHTLYPVNIWLDTVATHTYYLTKSFRFGPEIAYVIDYFMKEVSEEEYNIVGNREKSYVTGVLKGQCAIISCTYEGLIEEAIEIYCTEERYNRVHGAFVGPYSAEGIDEMIDMCMLKYDRASLGPDHELIRKYKNFKTLEDHARHSDESLASKVFLINEYGPECSNKLKVVKENCSYNLATADFVFCQVHETKGLAFDTVILADDFYLDASNDDDIPYSLKSIYTHDGNVLNQIKDRKGMPHSDSSLYVALTRAKKSIFMCESLWSTLSQNKEIFCRPVLSSSLKSRDLKCPLCQSDVLLSTSFSLVMPKVKLWNGETRPRGVLCERCSSDSSYSTLISSS